MNQKKTSLDLSHVCASICLYMCVFCSCGVGARKQGLMDAQICARAWEILSS